MTAPVLLRRNRPRWSRYSSPLRRAVRTSAGAPAARSNLSRPSSTLIVVSAEDRTDPFSASQFQPPSVSRSVRIRPTMAPTSTPKYAPVSIVLPLMQGSTSPSKYPCPGVFPAPVLRHQPDRPAGGLRRRVKAEELQRLQRGGPGLPRPAAGVGRREASAAVPQPAGILQREQARAPALVLHPGSLGCHVAGRRVHQIPQHLPADGGVAFEQPVDHAHDRRLARRRRPVRPADAMHEPGCESRPEC